MSVYGFVLIVCAFLMSFCIVVLLVNMCVCQLYNKLTYLLECGYTSHTHCSMPSTSNLSFLISDTLAHWRSALSAKVPECQKFKTVG